MSTGSESLEAIMTLASGILFHKLVMVVAVRFQGVTAAIPIRKDLAVNQIPHHIACELMQNTNHRTELIERFRRFYESLGLVFGESSLHPPEQLNKLSFVNRTTGVALDITSDTPVSELLMTGDCIRCVFR